MVLGFRVWDDGGTSRVDARSYIRVSQPKSANVCVSKGFKLTVFLKRHVCIAYIEQFGVENSLFAIRSAYGGWRGATRTGGDQGGNEVETVRHGVRATKESTA